MKFPKAIGACADELFKTKAKRLELQREVEALEAKESALKEHIIATLPKSQASGVAGRLARVAIGIKEVPQVKDWSKFYAYVRKHGRFDLMQKRLAEGPVRAMLEEDDVVPGVEVFKTKVVSLNKL